ncbi:AI-2E family transporter [Algicella marina]|uniref:AI-2E family transporter n=1 Tax=Algicella marina TaxID=2683284 RepID=A0A6P1T077_9RHOB|nr:AI-2E family transporter [Algicella marina]QHQ35033.1 AI-2E family transporter [Algicella marina]
MKITDDVYRYSMAILATFAIFAGLSLAQNVFAPTLLAIVIGVVFSPLANLAERMKLPRVAVAIFILVVGASFLAFTVLLLEPPVSRLIDRGPIIWAQIQREITEFRAVLTGLQEMTEEISDAVSGDEGGAVVDAEQKTSMMSALSFAPTLMAQIVIFIGALFFFVLTRREIYDALTRLGSTPEMRQSIAHRLVAAEHYVSRYFAAITLINAILGLATYLVMKATGMPSPILWAVLAALLNFMPYLGPSLVIAALGVTGVVVFDGFYSFVPALCFFALNILEGQFVTPSFVGQQLKVNALLVFVSLVFWLWLWGPVGGFVAIPVLLALIAIFQKKEPDDVPMDTPVQEALEEMEEDMSAEETQQAVG